MNAPRSNDIRPTAPVGPEPGARPAILIAVGLVCLACLGIVIAVHFSRVRADEHGGNEQLVSAETPLPVTSRSAAVSRPATPQRSPSTVVAAAHAPTTPGVVDNRVAPSTDMNEVVRRLAALDLTAGVLTEEQAATWKENLRQLIQQGIASVPAIREFLEKNLDVNFGPDAAALLGYASLRMALFDALTQIGSPVSEAVLVETLQNTTNPREIGQLAQDLNRLEPGMYQRDILSAARQTLALAAAGNLPNNADVAPLFQVLQQFGGADAVADLETSAAQWNYYAVIALAQLPDGAGIQPLIQMASGQPGGQRTAALAMLAGLASQSGAAEDALLNLIRQNSLSSFDWAMLVPFLAGNQMTFQSSSFGNLLAGVNPNDLQKTLIAASNQSYFTAPLAALTPAQIQQQMALLDRLLSKPGNPPAAVQAMQQAKATLEQRLMLLASSAGNN